MMKTTANWGKRVIRALLAGIACAVLVLFFNLFAMHSNVTLERIARAAIAPGGLAEDWIFGPLTGDVHYHEGRRFFVFFVGLCLFYTVLILLLFITPRLLSSAKSER